MRRRDFLWSAAAFCAATGSAMAQAPQAITPTRPHPPQPKTRPAPTQSWLDKDWDALTASERQRVEQRFRMRGDLPGATTDFRERWQRMTAAERRALMRRRQPRGRNGAARRSDEGSRSRQGGGGR
jgi:hypothetical protein